MEFSLPAWLGGLAGTIVAVAIYFPGIRIIERRLRAQSAPPATPARRTAFEDRLSVTRRIILGADVALFATLGYWIGSAIGGKWLG